MYEHSIATGQFSGVFRLRKPTPLFGNETTPALAEWQIQRAILKEHWNAVLGTPSFKDFQRKVAEIETFE